MNFKIKALIDSIKLKSKNAKLLEDKITIFTPNKLINEILKVEFAKNEISSFYVQFETFNELIKKICINQINDRSNIVELQNLLKKEKNYKFSNKSSFKLAKSISKNYKSNIKQDLSHFDFKENEIYKTKNLKKESLSQQEIDDLIGKFGKEFIFWIEIEHKEIREIIDFLKFYDNCFNISLIYPLEIIEESKNPNDFKYWEFSNVQEEALQVHNEILNLVHNINLNEIQIILPEDENFFYLNSFMTIFQKENLLKTFYSRNNHLKSNPYINGVISFINIITSELDYKSIFSIFLNPCFRPNFLKNSKIEIWNKILQEIPIYKFLDKKHRKEKRIRELEYGTWIICLKKIILNHINQEAINLNYQKNEIDDLIVGIFSFLQDIIHFQKDITSFKDRLDFFKTMINVYLNTEPRFYNYKNKELSKENENAKKLILEVIKNLRDDSQNLESKDIFIWKELFLDKLFFKLNDIKSQIKSEDSILISHLEDMISINRKVTFFCGFNEINYNSSIGSIFKKKTLNLEKAYFTYTNIDKNSETVLCSNLIHTIDKNIKWVIFQNIKSLNMKKYLEKTKNYFKTIPPNWEGEKENIQYTKIIEDLSYESKESIKNIFFKPKKKVQLKENKLQSINLASFNNYIECPYKFEFYQNFNLKSEDSFSVKENSINPINESIFYKKFTSEIIEKGLKKKQIKNFINREIFNEINLMTQKVPLGVLEAISKKEWYQKLNEFYQFLSEELNLNKCETRKVFEDLSWESEELKNLNFYYKTDIFQYNEEKKEIYIYILKRKLPPTENKQLINIEAKILAYLLQKIYPNHKIQFSIIAFKELKILEFDQLELNLETLNDIKQIFYLLINNNFPITPFSTKSCDYCNLANVCFGYNINFEENNNYNSLINSIREACI